MTYTSRKLMGVIAFLFIVSFLFSGCALMQVREDVKTLQKSIVLVGIVSSSLSYDDLPVVVAAYSKKDRKRAIVHYTTLHEPGPYELMVPAGTHNIIAFGDKNKNLMYDEGEPAGQILRAEQVSIPAGGVSGNLDVVITQQNSQKIDFPIGGRMPPKEHTRFHSTCPGAIANINDAVFSAEYGQKGLWESLKFFREISGNVYFLEAYDPKKIPILFIHGAAGSPQDWRAFFESIDRTRFQPWFFYYPSGSSIDSMSYLLFWKLQNLQTKYNFSELCITAHSMGGLVARSFMVNYGGLFPSIGNFISISTPWGGEELAKLGVKYSPAVIPLWRDMQPGSDFINSLYSKEMPPAVEYYLFFGHKGNRSLLRANNDKAVTLTSQLDHRSQRDAKMIYGFDEDHMSILFSEEVLSQYNAILAEIYQHSKDADAAVGNRLRVDFSFDFPEDHPRPMTALYLRPVGDEGREAWIYLGPNDTEREYGPFSPGTYEASLIAPAFFPEPASIPIRIEEGAIPRVQFTMKPTGFIRGYIPLSKQPHMQAGKERKPDPDIEIESITLKGNGINRTLTPLNEEKEHTYDDLFPRHYLSKTDFTTQGAFFFFGLPDGKYELTVNAKGFKSYSQTCKVKQGHYQNIVVSELKEEFIDTQ